MRPRLYAASHSNADHQHVRIYTTEIPPMQIIARVGPRHQAKTIDYQVWTPYVIALTTSTSTVLNLFCRASPLTPGDENLYQLYWPHIGGGSVCYYPRGITKAGGKLSQADRASLMVNEYFTTKYSYFLSVDMPPELVHLSVEDMFAKLETLSREETLDLGVRNAGTLLQTLHKFHRVSTNTKDILVVDRFISNST